MEERQEINAEWWAALLRAEDLDDYPAPELLSLLFDRRLRDEHLGELERQVIEVLATATSALANPKDWLHPFRPAVEFGGRRSSLPSDLDRDQSALLARLAPIIEEPSLRARVADVAWFYGDRSNVALLDLAIDDYRSAPLAEGVWFHTGKDAWQRAFELVKRRGPDGRARADEMAQRLKAEVLAGRVQDRWRIRDCAGLLRENVRLSSDDVRSIAEHLVALAADATDPPLSRGLEQEAAVWFRDHDANAMNGCIERIAHTYVAEARVAAGVNAGALAEGFFLENAISTLRTLPRRYRTDRGLEDLIAALRQRLTTSREIWDRIHDAHRF